MANLERATFDLPLTIAARGIWSMGFISGRVLTALTSTRTSGKLPNVDKEFLRLTTPETAIDGKFPLIKPHVIAGDNYEIQTYGLKDILLADERDNYYNPALFEGDRAAALSLRLKIAEEYALATALGDNTVLTQYVTLSGAEQYSHSSGGDPIDDFRTAREAIRSKIGMNPNKVIVPAAVKAYLKANPALLAYFYPSGAATTSLTDEQLATVLGGGDPIELLVPSSIYNSAKTGLTDSIADIWGKNIVFMFAPNTPAMGSGFMPTLGYKVNKTGNALGGTSDNPVMYRNPKDEPPDSILLQCVRKYDDVIVDAANCAYLIEDAIA